jgi:CRP/FNR family transcriptional regulator
LKIPCDEFLKFLRGNEKATAALLATMSEYLSYAEERLRIVVNHDAEDRLCALLEQVGERFGRPSREDPAFLRVQLTHQELAELSGLSRSHVSLIMARLRSNGIVRYGRSKPLTLDTGALARRREQRSAH